MYRRPGLITIILVISVAFLGGLYAYLSNLGWFEPWKPLGKPLEKPIKISFYEENSPLVQTIDGTIYTCLNSLSANQKDCWIKTEFLELPKKESSPCYTVDPFDVPKLPEKVIDMVEFESCPNRGLMFSTPRQHNFALLEDGSVWAWEYSHRVGGFAFFDIFIYTIMGAVLGLILGGVITTITVDPKLHKVDTTQK